jgi:predicted AAA+ superfamily ATPase
MTETIDYSSGYVRRVVDDELDAVLPSLPAVLLDGPKAVGKTATAAKRATTTFRLGSQAERSVVEGDPRLVGFGERPILIDEWQRVPAVFDEVKQFVDSDRSGGQFLLTGSAPQAQTHSGAGRITTCRMRPLSLYERIHIPDAISLRALLDGRAEVSGHCDLTVLEYASEITAGGFPGLRHLEGEALDRQLDSYIDRIVDHDMLELGFRARRPATLRRWLRAYAAATATSASWEKIRDAATGGTDQKPTRKTTQPYIELLGALRVIDPVDGWQPTRNHLRALTAGPKHHLADPAIAARLVRRNASDLVHGAGPARARPRDGSFLGALFESLVALSLRTYAQASNAAVGHLRTEGGRREVDFIVEGSKGVIGIEVKLAAAVSGADGTHLHWLRRELGDECIDLVMLNTGPQAYRRSDGIAVIPFGLLGP